MKNSRILQSLLVALLVSGCARVPVVDGDGQRRWMNQDEVAAYAEAVFRYHNATGSQAMLALASPGAGNAEDNALLVAAEARMLEACEPLNGAAISYRDGREQSKTEQVQLLRHIGRCERETRSVERLLNAAAR